MPIINGKYKNPGWVNNQQPPISAENLNDISTTLENLDAQGGGGKRVCRFVIGTSTAGWTAALVGVVLLVLELFSLIALQFLDAEIHQSWRSNAMDYAKEGPMPAIFAVTLAVIAAGALLAAGGLLAMGGKWPAKGPKKP